MTDRPAFDEEDPTMPAPSSAQMSRDEIWAQLERAEAEAERLRAVISWARGLCTDEAPYAEIDAGLGRALDERAFDEEDHADPA